MLCKLLAFLQRFCNCDKKRSAKTKTGVVKFFNRQKKYGFITQDDGAEDLFVHGGDVNARTLREGQKVSFEVGRTDKGLAAFDVTVIE